MCLVPLFFFTVLFSYNFSLFSSNTPLPDKPESFSQFFSHSIRTNQTYHRVSRHAARHRTLHKHDAVIPRRSPRSNRRSSFNMEYFVHNCSVLEHIRNRTNIKEVFHTLNDNVFIMMAKKTTQIILINNWATPPFQRRCVENQEILA